MSSFRTTNSQCIWLTLLVAFVVYVTDGIPSKWGESQAAGGELEIKAVVLEPDSSDIPVTGIPHHGNHPAMVVDDRAPAVDALLARNEADRITHIRGPPAGYRRPA